MNSRTFSAGDRILFRRGQVWREQLVVPSSGVSGRPITFGAYGSGNRPCFKGSAVPSGWTSQSSTVWRGSLGAAPNQVFFSGVRGTKVSGISSVNSARKWYWSSGTLYVYATSNPGSTIEASVRPSSRSYGVVHLQGRNYVTFESLEVTQSASFGLYIKPAANYITVRDCEVSHSLDGGLVVPTGSVSATQITIEDCLVHHNNGGFKEGAPGVATYHEGLTIENADGFVVRRTKVYNNYMEGSNFKRGARNGVIEYCDLYANDLINQYLEGASNIEVRYNRIYDCSYNAGIEFGIETDTRHNDNVRIHHNLFWNNSGGVSFWAGGFAGQTRNIRIENNTFFGNWEAIRWKSGAYDNYSGTNYIRNNLFWQNSTSNRAIWDYTSGSQAIGRTTISHNAFQQGAATAATGSSARVIGNPYFVNAGSRDFRLQSSSPCINVGASIGWTRDFEGTSIPQGGTPDIGADEYGSGSTPTPTSYTLSVSATNGAVTRTPNQSSYTAGQTVSLQATPNSGYTFSGWSGSLSGTANPASIVMDANKSVTANFTATSTGGTGATTKTVGNTTVFSQVATTFNRRAVPYTMPEAGQLQSVSIYHGGGSGQMMLAVYADSSGRPGTRLGVTNATAVNGSAGWQTIALQSPVSAASGQRVWLAWLFQNSTAIRCVAGTPGRVEINDAWTSGMPTSFGASSLSNYIYSVYANYTTGTPTAATYTLSTSATNGTITRTPNKTSYTSGETVTLQATPNSGYTFSGWSGSLTGTTNPATLVMNSNKSVTANFAATSTGGTTTGTVGTTTVLPEISTVANRRAAPYTAPQSGQLQSVSIYHQGGSGRVILAVYGDSSSRPGTRLGVTNATTINASAGWQTVALQSPVSVSSGQRLWLAWVFEKNPGVRYTAGTPGRAEAGAYWSGGMPTTFGASNVVNYIYSVYATYGSGSTGGGSTITTKTMGNATVFTSVGTAYYRRAVPYTMSEAGQLQSISLYHNGGTGQMLLGVYSDSSSRPGTRLGVTNATTVNGSAGWQTISLQSPASVSAGQKIWLAWICQNSVGVRCMAGTPGRAEGTAPWSGGLPTTFGTSTVGNYIYSIYATYTTGSTGTVASATVGNTTVFPGLGAVYNRRAVPYTMPEAGELQSISICHNGGSGQMLLGVYNDSWSRPGTRLGVTNPAAVNGSAGWQTVALQNPVPVTAGQKIWLAWLFQNKIGVRATAGTPGRAESTANWWSGMPATFGSSTVGNYIYSIYATYRPASGAVAMSSDFEAHDSSDNDVVEADASTTGIMAGNQIQAEKLNLTRSVCMDQTGRNQGQPASAVDAQGNTWVAWHAGDAGERQVYAAGFFPMPGSPASLCG